MLLWSDLPSNKKLWTEGGKSPVGDLLGCKGKVCRTVTTLEEKHRKVWDASLLSHTLVSRVG